MPNPDDPILEALTDHSQPPLPSEQLAMNLIAELPSNSLSTCIVMSPGRGQAARLIKQLHPNAHVISWFVDSHRAAMAVQNASRSGGGSIGADVDVVCAADLPNARFDLAVLPVLKTGEAEMNRELLQQACQRLRMGGRLIASVNAPNDHWLIGQMQPLFAKVRCVKNEAGCVYHACKTFEPKKVRNFSAAIQFRVDDQTMTTYSRPSVFSHRSVDPAARIVIRHVPIKDGDDVLEMGCGNGAVALAAAKRSPSGRVFAVDCNTRAIACVVQAAAESGITNLLAVLNHDGMLADIETCDISLLNPPYYGDFRIAQQFMATSTRYLRDGGHIWIVTKQADRYRETTWPNLFFKSQAELQGYQLMCYRKSSS